MNKFVILAGAALAYFAMKKASASSAAAARVIPPRPASSGSPKSLFPGLTNINPVTNIPAPALSLPQLSPISLSPVSVNLSPLPLNSINLTSAPLASQTAAGFWASLTPAPTFQQTALASSIAFPSGAMMPVQSLAVRQDGGGNFYVFVSGTVYQLGFSGSAYTAQAVQIQ